MAGDKDSTSDAHVRILLVDDDSDITDAITQIIDAAIPGCKVMTAYSGKEAMQLLEKAKADIILTDYNMPEMDGMEFLSKVGTVSPNSVRIMLTAFPSMDLVVGALNDGHIINFLMKPVHPERLVDALEDAIRIRKDPSAKAHAVASALSQAHRSGA